MPPSDDRPTQWGQNSQDIQQQQQQEDQHESNGHTHHADSHATYQMKKQPSRSNNRTNHQQAHLSVSIPPSSTSTTIDTTNNNPLSEKLVAAHTASAEVPSPTASISSTTSSTAIDLTWTAVFFYSCGHMLNDLCAACWFTYLLVMLRARDLLDWESALILLAGQLAVRDTHIQA